MGPHQRSASALGRLAGYDMPPAAALSSSTAPTNEAVKQPQASRFLSSDQSINIPQRCTIVFETFEEERAYVIRNIAPPEGDLLSSTESDSGSAVNHSPHNPRRHSNPQTAHPTWTKDRPRRNAESASTAERPVFRDHVANEWRTNPWHTISTAPSDNDEGSDEDANVEATETTLDETIDEPKSRFSWSSSSDGSEPSFNFEPEGVFTMGPVDNEQRRAALAWAERAHYDGSSANRASVPVSPREGWAAESRAGFPIPVPGRGPATVDDTGDDPRLSTAYVDPGTRLLTQRVLREEAEGDGEDDEGLWLFSSRPRRPASLLAIWAPPSRHSARREEDNGEEEEK